MKIKISKFGIIDQGIVDLNKALTVFCGPNGSGKTYMSYLIYALVSDNLSPVQPLASKYMDELTDKGVVDIPIPSENLINYRNKTIEIIKDRTNEIFGISQKDALKLFKDFDVSFLSSDDDYVSEIKKTALSINLTIGNSSFKIVKNRGRMMFKLSRDRRQNITSEDMNGLRFIVSSLIYQRLLTHGISLAHIFVVERSSIFTFNKELSLNRVTLIDALQDNIGGGKGDKNSLSKILHSNSTRYPLAIRRNLKIASDLSEIKKEEREYAAFADEIEKTLLNGNHVDVDSEGNVYLRIGKSLTLPIHMAASVVKTLAPIILTLRHLARPASLLIIDEPELNLHPAAQVVFARIMARMINKGLRLLISTHSDYIIRELNNMIMWGAVKGQCEEERKGFGYTEGEILNKKQVGVYVFDFDNEGSKGRAIISEVPVDDKGFEVEAIDRAISLINESSESAYASILAQDIK